MICWGVGESTVAVYQTLLRTSDLHTSALPWCVRDLRLPNSLNFHCTFRISSLQVFLDPVSLRGKWKPRVGGGVFIAVMGNLVFVGGVCLIVEWASTFPSLLLHLRRHSSFPVIVPTLQHWYYSWWRMWSRLRRRCLWEFLEECRCLLLFALLP